MRLLIASVNHMHVNTMHINFYHSLAEQAEVTFFGPGFSTEEELEKGILRFADKKGPFDAVIVAFPLAMSSSKVSTIREVYQNHRYFLSDYSVNQAVRYADDILDAVNSMDIPRIILFFQDYINIKSTWYDFLNNKLECGYYFLGVGLDFVSEVQEKGGHTFGDGLQLNNLYRSLLMNFRQQTISIPVTATSGDEYFFGPLWAREFDWVVPGNIDGCYPVRGQMLRLLQQDGYRIYSDFLFRTMAYKTDKTQVKRYEYLRETDKQVDERLGKNSPYLSVQLKREDWAAWRENYNVSLRKSKMAFADGGDAHVLVRKYFEIPARGTLLACENVVGLDKLGFCDGENMVEVHPENILDISAELFCNPERMEQIADSGRRLVLSKHTVGKRAEDTIKAIQAIQTGRFKGSHWDNGDFVIEE